MGNCCKKRTQSELIESLYDDNEENPLSVKLCASDFEKKSLLGRGSFGEVFLVKNKRNEKYYAMKILNKDAVKLRHQEVHTKAERDLMVKIHCPFIVGIKFAFQDKEKLYIITEFMQGGEIFYHLHKERKFNTEKTKFYISEIVLALEFLHNKHMLYRDLKPENILLGSDGHIKLTDFGLSKIFNQKKQKAYTICGTPQYLAPEILSDDGYDKTIDWWSLGCVMYEMLVGKAPFNIPRNGSLSADLYKKKIFMPNYVCKEAIDLISLLLVPNPKKRLGYGPNGANDIKKHEFFADINWEDLYNKKVKPPFVPELDSEVDLKYFDIGFTSEKIESKDMNNIDDDAFDTSNNSDNTNNDYKGFTYVTSSIANEMINLEGSGSGSTGDFMK